MSHIVKYRSPDGKTDYHHTDDIHDAVSFVEQLRNDQGVDGAQIYRLEEVTFEYRPYYRVELKATEPALAAPVPKPAVPATAPAAVPTAAPAASAPGAAAPAASPDPIEVKETKAPEPDLVSVPSTPSPTPAPAETSDPSSVGARRGLFGR